MSAYSVTVDIPSAPSSGSDVHLKCNYNLVGDEQIESMIWTKDGEEFMKYIRNPSELYSFKTVSGINVDVSYHTDVKLHGCQTRLLWEPYVAYDPGQVTRSGQEPASIKLYFPSLIKAIQIKM